MVEQCFLIRSLTWEQPLNSLIYWANGCATAETYMRFNVFTGGRVKIGGMYCVCVCAINMTLKTIKRVVSTLTVSELSSHHSIVTYLKLKNFNHAHISTTFV